MYIYIYTYKPLLCWLVSCLLVPLFYSLHCIGCSFPTCDPTRIPFCCGKHGFWLPMNLHFPLVVGEGINPNHLGKTWFPNTLKVDNLTSGLTIYTNLTSRAARGGGGSFKNRKRIGEIGCCESRMTKQKHWWIWLTAELSHWLTDYLAS